MGTGFGVFRVSSRCLAEFCSSIVLNRNQTRQDASRTLLISRGTSADVEACFLTHRSMGRR